MRRIWKQLEKDDFYLAPKGESHTLLATFLGCLQQSPNPTMQVDFTGVESTIPSPADPAKTSAKNVEWCRPPPPSLRVLSPPRILP
jgi:hypothetical protein